MTDGDKKQLNDHLVELQIVLVLRIAGTMEWRRKSKTH